MIYDTTFPYKPTDHESEKASNSYLMSLVAVIAGLPLPIINLLATLFFYIGNRKSTYFVRWHCTQALLSQLSLFFINSISFWWAISIIFGPEKLTLNFWYYLLFVVVVNILDFAATIYAAVETRKGIHVEWFLYGALTDMLCEE